MANQNDKSTEDIEGLLEKFLGAEQAQESAEEIRQGDKLFDLNPAPELSESGIAHIKARVAERLSGPKRTVSTAGVYKAAVAAAAVILWGWVAIQFLGLSRPETGMERTIVVESTRGTWSGWDETEADAEIASLDEEIDQIEGSILALRLGEQDSGNGAILADVETEMVEIDNFFWKG
jgi:hypothetical protein